MDITAGTSEDKHDVHIPFKSLLPMVNPDDLVLGGWDINSANLAEAMERACVLDYDCQRQLKPLLKGALGLVEFM